MTRYSWLLVAFACLTFSGCGEDTIEAPDEAAVQEKTPIEKDLEDAGMGNISEAEYIRGGKK